MPKDGPQTAQSHHTLILQVAIATPLRRLFDYLPPAGAKPECLQPGVRVLAPFGRGSRVGVITGLSDFSELPTSQLKRIQALLDQEPVLPAELMELVTWASRYYEYPLGEVVSLALPVLLRQGHAAQLKGQETWALTSMGREVDLASVSRAPRQVALLQRLQQQDTALSTEQLNDEMQQWRPVMNKLCEKGWVEAGETDYLVSEIESGLDLHANALQGPPLNDAQQQAVTQVVHSLGEFTPALLQGVTGSGKTEVYLRIIAEVIARQRQALVLVPEIGLTPQLIARFRARFPHTVIAVLHSLLTDQARLHAWLNARAGVARIIIGTRSAVMTPLPQPGVIIIDEEHDASYKQQDRFRYSARDVAIKRAQQHNIPVVLGSATPSLETLHNALQGRYQHLLLPERAGAATHPRIEIVDVRGQNMQDGLSAQLINAIRTQLQAGHQVLLFLNRRGFAPTLMCHECGWIARCQRCDSHMTLYQSRARLRCQHCGAERRMETACPECSSEDLLAVGQGTERIEGVLSRLFDGSNILRIDRDSTRRKNALQGMVEQVQRGEPCILVGTQMLAKGHHFPNVTLAGIVDADQGLFSADFRGAERMAQLLTQVAGRAGRAEKPGQVMIQTHHPEHPLLQVLVAHGYERFAEAALQERREAGLPPFSHLALLRAEASSRELPMSFLAEARALAQALGVVQVSLLGPVPAPMEKRAGRYRAQLLLQAQDRGALHRLLAPWLQQLEQHKSGRKVRWSIDVDPLDLF